MHFWPNSACKIATNQLLWLKRSLPINIRAIQEEYRYELRSLQSCSETILIQCGFAEWSSEDVVRTCLIKSRVKLVISINPLYVKLDRNLGRKKAVLVPVPSLILFLIKLNWDRDTAASLLDKVSMQGVESILLFKCDERALALLRI